MKKYTQEEIAEIFRKQNCELLDEYKDINHSLKYKCSCDNISTIRLDHFIAGRRCKICSGIKINQDQLYQYFKEQGCELLSKYQGAKICLEYICECGNLGKTRLDKFKEGRRCGMCLLGGRKKKHNIEEIKTIFKNSECEILEESDYWYKNVNSPINYKCSCGRIAKITLHSFKRGNRCGYCNVKGRKKRYSLEEIKNIFIERGCELLDDNYKNAFLPLNFKCVCNNITKISLHSFLQGCYCIQCGIKKHSGENHVNWQPDREQKKTNDAFTKRCRGIIERTLKSLGKKKEKRTYELLGYDSKQLQEYIKSHPNWEFVKDASWHLDHIFPIQAFLDHNIRDIKLINCLDNLQPLTEHENLLKHDTYNKEQFLEWLKTHA